MPCFSPLQGWRQPGFLKPGEKRIVFSKHDRWAQPLDIPCGQCIGCRLERSRQWACRLIAEAQCHEKTSFLTLTYAEMPVNSSLNNTDFTLFMKRLRRHVEPAKLRFFQCGEYGERTARPHHHCILFGEDFRFDRVVHSESQSGLPQFTSKTLDDLWSHGHCTIGDVTFESAAYVARYALKKVSGVRKDSHYAGRKPEFVTMSRRPGIGSIWFDRFRSDVYPGDLFVAGPDRPSTLPPKYFDKLLERVDSDLFDRVKASRKEADFKLKERLGQNHLFSLPVQRPDSTSHRLMVRCQAKQLTIVNLLKRGIE